MALSGPLSKKIMMIGNPGVGKSLILNGLVGSEPARFQSGLSDDGAGVTKKCQTVMIGDTEYSDSPGLADAASAEECAKEIERSLKEPRDYKIFFIVRVQAGRVVAEDQMTMRVVLNAVPTLSQYGVIVNQMPPADYERFKSNAEWRNRFTAVLLSGLNHKTSNILPVPRCDSLEGQENKVPQLPAELVTLVNTMPGQRILPADVREVHTDTRDQMLKEMAASNKDLYDNQESMKQALDATVEENKALGVEMERLKNQPEPAGLFGVIGKVLDTVIAPILAPIAATALKR
jgi:GTPase SAR1 family protein